MSFVSVLQACRRLGIDAKTLHRWLTEAALAVQPHPSDGRQKGVSEEHLETLARLHQRRLAPWQEDPSLAAAVRSLSERLDALTAQVAALQQQMAELARLSAPTPTPSPPNATPASPARHSPALATRPTRRRQPTPVLARVEYAEEGRYVVICPKKGLLPFAPESPAWFVWLSEQSSFRFVGKAGSFSAHHEARVPHGAWRAHRKIRNRAHSLRLAPTPALTIAVLEQAAATLQAHLR